MFYYFPLESYKERYTSLMSVRGGWIEDLLKKYKIEFIRVEGDILRKNLSEGSVLDICGRSYYSLSQCAKFINLISEGKVKDNDIIYFEDFWTPGIEAIQYTCQLKNLNIRLYTMLHAQTVDKYDFTTKLKKWMRHYEIGQSYFMSGIFVTSEYLMDLCVEAGLKNVYFGGLPYNSDFIRRKFKKNIKKENQIIFCSRFDEEKQPLLFIELAKRLKNRYKFIMTSSFKDLRSNSNNIKNAILYAKDKGIIDLKIGLSKEEYYEELQKSKYQFNSALQDWLSWTLLEALTFRCIPIYPRYRSFPEYLPSKYLYDPFKIDSIMEVIKNNKVFDFRLNQIIDKFDLSFERYLRRMELKK